MSELTTHFFDNPNLNDIANKLIELESSYFNSMRKAKEEMYFAFKTRYLGGKYILENYQLILENCGSIREFAERIGQTESVLSNNKRAYWALQKELNRPFDNLDDEWNAVCQLLESKQLKPTIYNLERLPKLLNEPQPDSNLKFQRNKDEDRLLQLQEEMKEILLRNESSNHNIFELASENLLWSEEAVKHIRKDDPLSYTWKSDRYLDFVKSIGKDFITNKPEDAVDAHHTYVDGSSGGFGMKLPDVFTIPVSRHTHQLIENGQITPDELETAKALIKTMALFIMNNYDRK